MSNFEDTTEDIENRCLAKPEDVSLLVVIIMDSGNLSEQTHDAINRGRLNSFKKHSKTTI